MLSLDVDAIVTNAAGCGSTMKEYAALLEHDAHYAERARQFVAKVRDITEYLADVSLLDPKRKLDEPGSLLRPVSPGPCPGDPQAASRIAEGHWRAAGRDAPRRFLLRQRRRVQRDPERNLDEDSRREDGVGGAGRAEIIATANVGCMLQLAAGVKRKGMKTEVVHVVEFLDRVY